MLDTGPDEVGQLVGRERVARITAAILFVTLSASVVYASLRMAQAPLVSHDPATRARADYALMLIQCAGGLVVMFLPALVHRRFAVKVSSGIQVAYFAFLYGAIYLGEVRDFYFRFSYWDTVLHFLSGAMLGAIGFQLVGLLNDSERRRVTLGGGFVAFFAFCFALACGAVWEIYEFTVDGLAGTNMQKFMTAGGELLVGREALADTMEDLIVDAVAAASVTIAGYLVGRYRSASRAMAADEGS